MTTTGRAQRGRDAPGHDAPGRDAPGRDAPGLPPRRRRAALARALAVAAAAGVPVAALAWLVRSESDALVGWDRAVVAAATGWTRQQPGLPRALVAWQEATQPVWLVAVVALVALVLWRRHGLGPRAAWATATVLLVWGFGVLLKDLVGRARPTVQDALEHAPGFSFPSGHATNSAACATALVLLLRPVLRRRPLGLVAALAAAVVAVTAADRVLLGVHHPSDVLAGLLVGSLTTAASYVGWSRWRPPPARAAHERGSS
ncbi:phosphatase PAP2 family protein [Cellulomonas endophytica]|uniref:phosphatase PAP2 family protein n=1 Tax=Cellulomonas endophytica TaxID=2494735 RepID=UPI0010116AD6|nr:phosphatase PAP2 family protein [Cellulomonas endophytica]